MYLFPMLSFWVLPFYLSGSAKQLILVSCFKDGLNDDLYHAYITQGASVRLHDWGILAKEAEIN